MVDKSEKILHIAQNRGFFYPSAEIYGSKAGFWTYGHLGTRIKQKWENLWRNYFLGLNPNYFEVDDCHIMPKKVFESSGHLKNFNDPLTECEKCHFRFRADQLIEDALAMNVAGLDENALTKLITDNKLVCPKCQGKLMQVKWFNMMFELKVGATGDDIMYLRPESAQSPYLAFKREYEALRKKIPFGLAVLGKAYRNEISPRQGFFRLREFSQAELQIFFNPQKISECKSWDKIKNYKLIVLKAHAKEAAEISCETLISKHAMPKFYLYHMVVMQKFYLEQLQIPKERFMFRELDEKERAFYNKIHYDVELKFDTLGGFKEVAGLHYRGDHDLLGHQNGSGQNLEAIEGEEKFIPHVLELSFGIDRNIYALLDIFYTIDKERDYFAFPTLVTPIDVAVFPLVSKDNIPEMSEKVFDMLKTEFKAFYDESGSIGRRYRRQDEIGTKFEVTIDYDSLKDNDVTIRERDSMKQIRVKIDDLVNVLHKLMGGKLEFEKAGKPIVKKTEEHKAADY